MSDSLPPTDYSTPDFPVLHYLLEFAQTHVHWVDDTIQPSCPVTPFSHLQSFPASRSFPMSWLFASGGQSIGASASVLPVNIQGWFPLGLTGLVSFQSKGLSRLFLNITVQKVLVEKNKKNPTANAGDTSSIPGSGRSPREGNGNPLQYSWLENPQGQRSLAGYSPWGLKESDTTEQLSFHLTHCSAAFTSISPK